MVLAYLTEYYVHCGRMLYNVSRMVHVVGQERTY
jgi:hypothetical protein